MQQSKISNEKISQILLNFTFLCSFQVNFKCKVIGAKFCLKRNSIYQKYVK